MSELLERESVEEFRPWTLPDINDDVPAGAVSLSIKPKAKTARPQAALSAAELERLQKQAWDEAWQKGHEEGLKAGQQAAAAEARKLAQALTALAQPTREMDEQIERELLELALCVAREVIGLELETRPELVQQVIGQALNHLPSAAQEIRVFLNPEDAALMETHQQESLSDGQWEIRADARVRRGGCRIESRSTQVDATLETRIKAIFSRVMGEEPDQSELFDSGLDGS